MNEKLEKAKEIIAKELNYKDWETCINDQPNYKIEGIMDKVAERYHELMNDWIGVDDRLPKVDNTINTFGQRVECLVFWENDVYKGTYVNLGTPFWSVSHVSSSSSLNVTHWKPLPTPPKQ